MRDFHLPGRSAAYGQAGMAATSHPEATLTALDVLRGGGNAIDAAVAASAVLGVVEPQMTGFGGDMFALVAGDDGRVFALASAGAAPAGASLEGLRAEGLTAIASNSAHAVTVPGYVAGIEALVERLGTRSLDELLRPAARLAEEGFLVTPRVAHDWARGAALLAGNDAARAVYLPHGRAPKPGERVALPALARTLKRLMGLGAAGFYGGDAADAMTASLAALGGRHAAADFAGHRAAWVEPIKGDYRGLTVYECPPPGQGVVTLLLLNLLEALNLDGLDPNGAERYHLEAEATKLAFALRDAHLADPEFADVPTDRLLDPALTRDLARRIDRERAMTAVPERLIEPHPDTVYTVVVDRERTVCSFISSIYDGFGSGIVCPETGILFHSRGRAFRLDPAHPNALAPGKRPMHTIIPGMALQDGRPCLGFGVMGGDYQPVGQAHLLGNMLVYGMDPQSALDHPRAMAYPDDLQVERGISPATIEGLEARGHTVREADGALGGGQAILIDRDAGTLVGGSDPRKDGLALGF